MGWNDMFPNPDVSTGGGTLDPSASRAFGSPMLPGMATTPTFSGAPIPGLAQPSPMQPSGNGQGNWMDVANGLLKQYGLSIRPQQNLFLPEPGTSGFFGQHPNLSRGIETALMGAQAHSGLTVGDSISSVAQSIMGAPLQRQQAILQREMLPFGLAGQMEQLHGMQAKNNLEAAQAEMYKAHGNYWDSYQRRQFTGQPWADNKGNLWQTNDVTGAPAPMKDPSTGLQMQGSPKFMGRSAMPGAGIGKTQSERQAYNSLSADDQDVIKRYNQTGQLEDDDDPRALSRYNSSITHFNAINSGAKTGASAGASMGVNRANGGLSDIDKQRLSHAKDVYDQKVKSFDDYKTWRRKNAATVDPAKWADTYADQKAASMKSAQDEFNAASDAIINGTPNPMAPPAAQVAPVAKPAAPGNGNPYRRK